MSHIEGPLKLLSVQIFLTVVVYGTIHGVLMLSHASTHIE